MAYKFDPLDGSADQLSSPTLPGFPAGDFSILLVFRRDRVGHASNEMLLNDGNYFSPDSRGFRVATNNRIQCAFLDTSSNAISLEAPTPDSGVWYAWIVTFNYDTLTAVGYLNGAATTPQTLSAWNGVSNGAWFIGGNQNIPFAGAIADWAYWSRVLTAQEISDLSNFQSGVRARDLTTGLLALYEMDGLTDWQGQNSLTVTMGSPTLVEGPYPAPGGLDPIADLSAQAGNSSVSLSWTPPTGATSQQLHRSTESPVPQDGSAAIGSPLAGNASATTDPTAENGTTYYYKLSATNGQDTVWSNEVSATPQAVDAPPVVTITKPAGAVTIGEGVEIVLEGHATDAEDGPLTGEDLVWESNVDGVLGTGEQITSALSGTNENPVVHTITLTATDSADQEGTDSVVITVGIGQGAGGTNVRRQRMERRLPYGRAATLWVPLYAVGSDDFATSPVVAAADFQISRDGGSPAALATTPATIVNSHLRIDLSAAELTCQEAVIRAADAGGTWAPFSIQIETTDHPQAKHPNGVIAAGTVSAASNAQNLTVNSGLTLPAGAMIVLDNGAAGLVQSYNSGTGALVLEAPGLPSTPSAGVAFRAYAAPRPGLEVDSSGRVAADVEAVAGTVVAGPDDLKADVSNLDVPVSSRLAASAYVAPDNAGISDIQSRLPAALVGGRIAADLQTVNGQTQIEGYTPLQLLRLFFSVLLGRVTGAGTNTIRFRDAGNTKDRVVATVDESGNRSAVTLDAD